MRRVYLRHADKEYSNGSSDIFKHDPGITENGMIKTKKIFNELVKQWGLPTRIVSSPYRRTRETALVLNSCLEKPFEEIYIDVNLSEYLGNHYKVALDVTSQTKNYEPPHPENFSELNERVFKHNIHARKRANELDNGVIWYVTHGLIIKQLTYLIGINLQKQLPPLTCFSITEELEMTKGEFLLFEKHIEQKVWRNVNV